MVKEIPTSKGYFTIVDDADYEWLLGFRWHYNKGYAQTYIKLENGKKKHTGMHRLIMNPPDDMEVDHINGIKHDNRRENLRIVTKRQNSWNVKKVNPSSSSSQYKGVSKYNDSYVTTITYNIKRENIGTFTNEIAAANAYNYFAKKYHGEFANLNDVPFMEKEEWIDYKYKTTSEFQGVHWHQRIKKWVVSTYDENNKRQTATFENEIVAANYYNHQVKIKVNDCEYMTLEECENLRCKRKSKYNGVTFDKSRQKWIAQIKSDGKNKFLGYYSIEEDAALAFNNKAIELNIENLDKKLNKIGG